MVEILGNRAKVENSNDLSKNVEPFYSIQPTIHISELSLEFDNVFTYFSFV